MAKFMLLALFGLITLVNSMKSYENYKVYSIVPSSDEQVQLLIDLREQGYEFWNDVFLVGNDARVMVGPEQNDEFVQYSLDFELNSELTVSNLQELINAQMISASDANRNSLGSFSWERYHTLDEIHSWLDELVDLYPNVVTTVELGLSNEGRSIKGVIIDFKAGEREGTPLIGIIEGGIHAREWISPATVTWIIKEFLSSTDPDVRSMAESLVWHIVPVTNPDGYAYTFSNNRMWRKNRNYNNEGNCTADQDLSNGIDLNRNFDYLWMTTGASQNPCDQTYAGPSGGSEPETQAVSAYVQQLKAAGDVIYYIAFHSYSQMILIPYSHASGMGVLEASNYADLYEIAIRGASRLTARHGTAYTVGTSAEILYEVSGSSFDWVKGVADIPIVYLFELRDVGQFGFLLPTEQIVPNNEEIMDCLIEMDRATKELGYYTAASATTIASWLLIMVLFLLTC